MQEKYPRSNWKERFKEIKCTAVSLGAGFTMSVYRTDRIFLCFLIVMVGAEVQETISPECKQFLYMGTPPRGLEEQQLTKICQIYAAKPRFVTLYDTINHIPVYSAYIFKRSDGSKKVDVPWMYEPQVGMVLGICCLISCACFCFKI